VSRVSGLHLSLTHTQASTRFVPTHSISGARQLLLQTGFCIHELKTAGNSLSVTGYLLGMDRLDIPANAEPRFQEEGAGEGQREEAREGESQASPPVDLLRYYGVYVLAQRPPCLELP
jgi:hypothetical protein